MSLITIAKNPGSRMWCLIHHEDNYVYLDLQRCKEETLYDSWIGDWKRSNIEASKWILKQTKGTNMKTAEAYYIPDPVQIYVYIDEKEIKELPENAVLICKVESSKELVKAIEPFFILGSGS